MEEAGGGEGREVFFHFIVCHLFVFSSGNYQNYGESNVSWCMDQVDASLSHNPFENAGIFRKGGNYSTTAFTSGGECTPASLNKRK